MADRLLCLDVGEKRIGVADLGVKIAIPLTTIEVDGTEIEQILRLYGRENARTLVVGYPRNQQGETTAQTVFVEEFVKPLEEYINIEFQDESLTSVQAEQRLKSRGQNYTKGDIDSEAATIILQDYMETKYGY